MKKIIILLLAISIFPMIPLVAQQYSGKNLQLLGDSTIALGRGGTGVASTGADFFYLNPASIANSERIGIGLQYGNLLGKYYNPDITIAIPTSYGVFGTSFRYFNIPDNLDFKSGYSLSIGGAKDFTSRVMIGLSINLFYGTATENLFYAGATIGSIYMFDGSKNKNGFGLFEPKAGLAINFGAPMGDEKTYANFNTITIGYNFQFYRHKIFNLGFFNDFSVINWYRGFPVKAGLEAEFLEKYTVRAGMILPQEYDYGDFTFGLGYKLKFKNFAGTANYSLIYYNDMDFVHYLGLNFEYGELDRQPPDTNIQPDNKYLSPNHDGSQDYVLFSLGVEDKSRIKGWKLQVMDSDNKVVREFRMSERDIIEGLTFKGFFKRLIQKKESLVVPESIMWDGTDLKGVVMKDGKYTYSFNAWDERDNIAVIKTGTVIVDNTSPEVTLTAKEALFSPNEDNQKDTYIIKQDIKTSPADEWTAGFKNSKGKIIKRYKWNGENVPGEIVWNGKKDNGKDAPDGLYYYFVKTTDKAGNSAMKDVKEITLTRQYEVADITLSGDYFSFKKDKELILFPSLSQTEGLVNWRIIVKDKNNNTVKQINGKNKLPKLLNWDCRDSKGKKLKDGEYFLNLSTKFKSGNTPASFEKKLIIDSTPPELETSHSPELFSPDDDGENDILTIEMDTDDQFGINEWEINIYAPSGALFKSFSGKGDVPDEIKWDGLGEDKDIVESAADYYIELEAVDFAGNSSKSKKEKLQIDILVIVTERGLKIRVSNIEFAFGRAKIMKKGKVILNRVMELLDKYKRYDIIIEGHTDDIGKEDYNLKLSEKRAKSVHDYMVKNGIHKERLQFLGMGETTPLYENTSKENKRRNRRVEFLLIKKE